jgi:hypothetical protein
MNNFELDGIIFADKCPSVLDTINLKLLAPPYGGV